MPRSKVGKKRPPVDPQQIKMAINAVVNDNIKIRRAAVVYNVTKSTLSVYVKKYKDSGNDVFSYSPTNAVKQVFSKEEEMELEIYLKKAAKMQYGLTKKELLFLAYSYAKKNNKNIPNQWETSKCAGREWLRSFLKRHPSISLRKPESTSLARSSSFNRHNVATFFTNLRTLLEKFKFGPSQIYNIDETGNTNVHRPPKILAPKGIKQLGSMTSGERGFNVTMISAINAVGNQVPPMLIFPRVHFKDFMINGAPPGTVGAANPSGWSNEIIFLDYMKHFLNEVKPSKENPVLVIFDNHESHISVPLIDLAKDNGVELLTFPPHTSHKLQPLDRTVFGPYKTYYNQAVNDWLLQNPGKSLTIYQIAEIVGKAYPKAFVPHNITKGFAVTGICPYNENIFGDDEFLPSYVTDRPMSANSEDPREILREIPTTVSLLPGPGCSRTLITPEDIRPFQKAEQRKRTGGRRQGKTRILTWTPEKNMIEAEKLQKQTKKKNVGKITRKILDTSSSDEKESLPPSESDEDSYSEKEDSTDIQMEICSGDYVLVKLQGKKWSNISLLKY